MVCKVWLPVAQLVGLPHLRGRLVQQSVPSCKHIQVRAIATAHIASNRYIRRQTGVQNLSHHHHFSIVTNAKPDLGQNACLHWCRTEQTPA